MDPIISPDVRREARIPPRQVLTKKWPVLHYGSTPAFDRAAWTFEIFGRVPGGFCPPAIPLQ